MERIFCIRAGLIEDLLQIARAMNARGWVLKIEAGVPVPSHADDAGTQPVDVRPIVQMCVWECGGGVPPPELVFRRAKCLVAIIPCTGTHLCGAAVDVSVFRRGDGTEVWRGKPIEISEYTPMESPFVTAQEQEHRREITRLMEEQGFLHYPVSSGITTRGTRCFKCCRRAANRGATVPVHWNPHTGEVTPFADVHAPLTPPDVFQQLITDALQRIQEER